jgi:hypothetical protein
MPTFLHGKNTRVMFVNPSFTSQTFTASATNGSPTITIVNANFSLIAGMGVTAAAGLVAGTVILSASGRSLTLSNNFTGTTGTIVFTASSAGISYDISQFFNDVGVMFAGEAAETTTFQTGGVKSYIAGLREGSISLGGLYDGTVNGVDAILNTAIANTGDEGVIVFPDGAGSATAVSRCYVTKGIETKYDLKSPVSGVVAVDTEIQADGGVWRGHGQTFTQSGAATTYAPSSSGWSKAAGNSSSTGSQTSSTTTNGGLLIMGVTALSGTSPTVALTFQHSQDGSTWTTPTGGDLGTESGVGGVVTVLAGSIYNYTRLQVVLGGTSPSANIYYGISRF